MFGPVRVNVWLCAVVVPPWKLNAKEVGLELKAPVPTLAVTGIGTEKVVPNWVTVTLPE